MKVYALIGKSGTGKSYKALNVAYNYNIDLVIDDGLLINGSRLLGGKSAKKENTTIGAVKRAIFHHRDHRNEIIKQIKIGKYNSILILGTSDRMVKRIANNLKLGNVDKKIYITDISTKEELKLAYYNRNKKGKHIIPLPTLELKKHFSGYLLDRVKSILNHETDGREMIGEKTVTRPTFSFYGKFTISDNTIIEIMRIATKNNKYVKFRKARVIKNDDSVKLVVYIDIVYGINIESEVLKFQQIIINNIYKMTLLNVIKCDVIIKDLDY
jgi:uncharacterized alkaline shock family protein YloU